MHFTILQHCNVLFGEYETKLWTLGYADIFLNMS